MRHKISLSIAVVFLISVVFVPLVLSEEQSAVKSNTKNSETAPNLTEDGIKETDLDPATDESAQGHPMSKPEDDGQGGGTQAVTIFPESKLPQFSGQNIQVDPYTGSASTSIAISVPPGRAGIQPNISLDYNSSFKNGPLGIGWNLELGSIQRSLKKGPPKYDSTDTFELIQGGSRQELVYDTQEEFYRPETEGAFMRVERITSSDSWLVTDRKGTKYYFGVSSTAREFVTDKVYKWALEKVEDIHGNAMVIYYWKNDNRLYPDEIRYTIHESTGLGDYANVKFDWVARPDTQFSYASGFLQITGNRLKEIRVSAGSSGPRTYRFGYTLSTATQRSLLTSVEQVGADGSSVLPATTFKYHNEKGFELASGWTVPSGMMFSENLNNYDTDWGARITDINGDAYPDMVKSYTPCSEVSGPTQRKTYLYQGAQTWVDGSGQWDFPSNPPPGFVQSCPTFIQDKGVRLADVDGDGWVDMIRAANNAGFTTQAYINNHSNGWETNNDWELKDGVAFTKYQGNDSSLDLGTQIVDVNNDGYADIVQSKSSDAPEYNHRTYINNAANDGTGWTRTTSWDAPGGPDTDLSKGASLIDLNGDGLPEFVYIKQNENKIKMNTSQNWMNSTLVDTWNEYASMNVFENNYQFADINGDGLTDLIVTKASNMNERHTRINTGNMWVTDPAWALPDGDFKNLGTRLLDANADGMLDFLIHYNNQPPKLYLNKGKPADLLYEVDNGVGAKTTIEYGTSAQFPNTFLPFPIPVVKSVTVSNSLGDNYKTRYEYAQGKWDAAEREFRGFGEVKTFTLDENGETIAYSIVNFAQDDIEKGRILRERAFDSDNNLYSETVNDWDSDVVAPGVNFVFLRRVDNFLYDGDATGKRTAQELFYEETPQLGNLTKAVDLGEVNLADGTDSAEDSRTVETDYHNNEAAMLLGLPKETRVYAHDGTLMRQSEFFYDDDETGAVLPVKGFLTKKIDWAGTGNPDDDPVVRYSYNQYGNLETTTDALGNTTTIIYDSQYHIFPVTTINALGHSVSNVYYGVNAPQNAGDGTFGLWGQTKSTTDPNGQTALSVYDTFGRAIKTVAPTDSLLFPTTEVSYELNPTYGKVTSRSRVESGQDVTIDGAQFYDGLGRLIQSKSRAEETGQYIISGQTEYNSRGLPEKQYIARYTSNDFNTLDSLDTNVLHSTIHYDAMGRVVRTDNPDGTYASAVYDDWNSTTINENGHQQKSYLDSRGRLIKKEEYLGADGRSPHYEQTAGPVDNYYTLYATTLYEYDSEGNLTKVIDAKNNITTIQYDKLGRKISMDDPDMGVWNYEYDKNGNLKAQTDAKNQRIEFSYDELNRLVSKHYALSSMPDVNYTYDDPSVDYSKGRLTKAAYGGTLLSSSFTSFEYDMLGREINSTKKIDQGQYSVERGYDALNRLVSLQYPDDTKIYYAYNAAGQIEKAGSEPLSNEVWQSGSAEDGPFAHYKFNDNAANPTVVDTGEGDNDGTATVNTNTLSQSGKIANAFNFDGTQHINIDGFVEDVKFDTTGSFALWVNPQAFEYGQLLSFGGTVDAHLLMRFEPNNGTIQIIVQQWTGTGPLVVLNVEYWGALGNNLNQWTHIALVQDGTEIKFYKNGVLYEPSYQVATNKGAWFSALTGMNPSYLTKGAIGTPPDGAGGPINKYQGKMDDVRYYKKALTTEEIAFLYNNGNGTEESVPQPSTPDEDNLYVKDVNYNAQGQITQIVYGNDVATTYTYDPLTLRLAQAFTQHPTEGVSQNLSYSYDSAGNIRTITNAVDNVVQSFSYDELARLKTANGAYGLKNYEYDEVGNITLKDGLSYTYGENGGGPHAVTSLSDGTQFGYDANGNMAYKIEGNKTTEFKYDVENRLVEVKKNGKLIARYDYDGDGGRTKKTVYKSQVLGGIGSGGSGGLGSGGSGAGLSVGFRSVSSGPVPQESLTEVTRYVGSLYEVSGGKEIDHIYIGSTRVASITNGKIHYNHTDHLGGANVTTDEHGVVNDIIEYEPFGVISRHDKFGDPSETAHFYFTGQKLDDETGLMYYGARYYDPKLGRFITPDTIVQAPGNPQTFNRYSYAGNNPVNNIDPSGHSWKSFWKALGIAVVGTFLTVISGGILAPLVGAYWAGVAGGALAGATIGGTFAAATGGNIGMGLITGAVGGAIFGGIGGLHLDGWAQVGSHFAGGATSGAINGSITGGNVGISALSGGFSAGISEWAGGNIDFFKLTGNYITDVVKQAALGGIVGGATSAAFGGNFKSGFINGAEMSAIGYTSNNWIHKMKNTITPDRVLGVLGNSAKAAGEKGLANALKVVGNVTKSSGPFSLIGSIAGGSSGFQLGGQVGAKIGFWGGLVFGPGAAVAGAIAGYGVGAVGGGIIGSIYGGKAFEAFDNPHYGNAY